MSDKRRHIQTLVDFPEWDIWTEGTFGPRVGFVRPPSMAVQIQLIDAVRIMRVDPEELEAIFKRPMPIGAHVYAEPGDEYARVLKQYMFTKQTIRWRLLARLLNKTLHVFMGVDPDSWHKKDYMFTMRSDGKTRLNPRFVPAEGAATPSRVQTWFFGEPGFKGTMESAPPQYL